MSALYDSKTKTMDDRGIRALLTEEEKFRSWLDIEAALAKAQSEIGIIPADDAKKIILSCRIENIDINTVNELQREIGHGFVPFLKMLVKACPADSGKFVHYGVTTQNIQQSAQLLVMKKVHVKFKRLLKRFCLILHRLPPVKRIPSCQDELMAATLFPLPLALRLRYGSMNSR